MSVDSTRPTSISAPGWILPEDETKRKSGRLWLVESGGSKDIVWITGQSAKAQARENGMTLISDCLGEIVSEALTTPSRPSLGLENLQWIQQRVNSHNQKVQGRSASQAFFAKMFYKGRANRYDTEQLDRKIGALQLQDANRRLQSSKTESTPSAPRPPDRSRPEQSSGGTSQENLVSRCLQLRLENPQDPEIFRLLKEMAAEQRKDLLSQDPTCLRYLSKEQANDLYHSVPANEAKELFKDFSREAKNYITQRAQHVSVLPGARNPQRSRPTQSSTLDFSKLTFPLTEDQWQKMRGLISARDEKALNALQTSADLRKKVGERAKSDPGFQLIGNTLQEFESYPDSFRSQKSLLKTLFFIAQQRKQIPRKEPDWKDEFRVGNQTLQRSRRFPNVIKIQLDQDTTAHLDAKTLKIVALKSRALLGEGTFKTAKKRVGDKQQWVVTRQLLTTKNREQAQEEVGYAKRCEGQQNIYQLSSSHIYTSRSGQEIMITEAPLYEKGELFYFVVNPSPGTSRPPIQNLSGHQKISLLCGLIRGPLNAHKKGIIHSDIKMENYFLKEERNPKTGATLVVPYLADFGLSRDASNQAGGSGGTAQYASPEMLERGVATKESDAWALGCVLHVCHKGQYLYHGTTSDQLRINGLGRQHLTCPAGEERASLFTKDGALTRKEKAALGQKDPEKIIEGVIWGLTRPDPTERLGLEKALAIMEGLLARTPIA